MTLTPDLRKRIIRLIDRRLDVRLPDRLTTPLTGQVEELVPSTRTVLVRLDGSSAPVPVHLPMMPGDPVAGARVSVDRTVPGGTLVLDKVLDRDRDTSLQVGRPAVVLRAGGEGVDDAPAFRTAVEAAEPGTIFYLPDTAYLFKSKDANNVCVPINRSNITFVGRGHMWQGEGGDNGDTRTTTAIIASGGASGAAMFQWYADRGANTTDDSSLVWGGGLEDLSLYGLATAKYGVELQLGVQRLTFRNLHIAHFTDACMIIGSGCTHSTTIHGWHAASAHQLEHVAMRAFQSSHCLHLTGNPNVAGGENSYGIRIIGCDLMSDDGDALLAEDCDDIFLFGTGVRASGTGRAVRYKAPTATKSGGGGRNVIMASMVGTMDNILAEGSTGTAAAARMNVVHGMSTEDRSGHPSIEPGAHLWYDDDQGRSNLRRDIRTNEVLYDDFIRGGTGSSDVGDLGWTIFGGGSVSRQAGVASHPGIRRVTTGASAGTLAGIALQGNAGFGFFLPSESFILEWVFRLTQVDTDTMFRAGLAGAFDTDPPANGIFVEKLYADTGLWAVCRSGGVQTRTSLLTTVVAGTWYRLTMRRRNVDCIGFSLGEVTNWNDTVKTTTNVPTASMDAFAHMKNQAASAKTFDVDAFQLTLNGIDR